MQCRRINNHLSSLSSLLPSKSHFSFPSTNCPRTAFFPVADPSCFKSPRTNLCVSRSAVLEDLQGVHDQKATGTMYDVLLVPETADEAEIKAAFRRQARRWHPDTCRGQSPEEQNFYSQQFMKAKEAYTLLSDPELREEYDFMLRTGLSYHGLLGVEESGGVVFRKGKSRGGDESWGFGDWESQLEGLGNRRDCTSSSSSSSSWGSRMRAGQL